MAGSPLEHVVARASGLMLTDRTAESVLGLLTATVMQVVPAASGAGISLLDGDGGREITSAATDPLVEAADAVQYRLDEGPCLTAWRTRGTVRIDDVATDGRWPRWAAAVAPLAVGSVLSAPMVAGDDVVGALKLYGPGRSAFSDRDEATLGLFAAQCAILVSSARTFRRAGHLADDVRSLLAQRDALERATGLLMGRERLSEQGALAHLMAMAERERVSIHQVVARLLSAHTTRVAARS